MVKINNSLLVTWILGFILVMLFIVGAVTFETRESVQTYDYAVVYFYNGGKLLYQELSKNVEIKGKLIRGSEEEALYVYDSGVMIVSKISKETYDMYNKPLNWEANFETK
jgi:hypothetical protein